MTTVQITIIADTDEQLNNRLAEIADQIQKGYSGATGKTKTESFKYIVKEATAGTSALLPRLPQVEGNAADSESEQEEQENDVAGVMPVTMVLPMVLPMALPTALPTVPTLAVAA